MKYQYELIHYSDDIPVRVFMHTLDRYILHWHKELEVLLVVEGEIGLVVDGTPCILKEGDITLINSNQIHGTERTGRDNLVVAMQINTDFFTNLTPDLSAIEFDCVRSGDNNSEVNYLRYCLANIMVESARKNTGYHFAVNKYINSFLSCLVRNFKYKEIEKKNSFNADKDKERLSRIIEYVKYNYQNKITLQQIADNEHLNFYYLSHFFKEKVGISFQQYVNSVRLESAIELLIQTDKQLSEISDLCGFSSTKLMTKVFKTEHGLTPGAYRKKQKTPTSSKVEITINKSRDFGYTPDYQPTDLSRVIKYCSSVIETEYSLSRSKSIKYKTVECDALCTEGKLDRYFIKMTSFSRAAEGLRVDFQNQLRELQEEINFKYIRFHGIFNDEMMIYNIGDDGSVQYNFSYVNKLFDFFISVGIKPFIELSCMPGDLKSAENTVFWWKGNVSPPNDINKWCDLVESLIKHCINRYGIDEVSKWYIEVWNEPDLGQVFWSGTKKQYLEFFAATARTVKKVCSDIRVGGPAVTSIAVANGNWIPDFMEYCKTKNVPLDFLSYHIYPEQEFSDNTTKKILSCDYVGELIEKAHKQSQKYGYIETNITEWNISFLHGNPINDSGFAATSLVRDIIGNQNKVSSIAHWTFTDIYEENKAGKSELFGGFGLVNRNGIKKPTYWAYYFLSKLGDDIILQDDFCIVTRAGDNLQIFCWNHPEIENAYDTDFIKSFDDCFEIDLNIKNIEGWYKVSRYVLDKEKGDASEVLKKMRVYNDLTQEEIKFFKSKAVPEYNYDKVFFEGSISMKVKVESCGMYMILLRKVY